MTGTTVSKAQRETNEIECPGFEKPRNAYVYFFQDDEINHNHWCELRVYY